MVMHFPQSVITKEDVEFYSYLTDELLIKTVEGENGRKLGFPDGDINLLIEQFRSKDFTKYCRKDDWRFKYTNVLDNYGYIRKFNSYTANFRFVNKWNQESVYQKYLVIFNDDNKIIWIGNDENRNIENIFRKFYICYDEEIFEISYEHKYLNLFSNIAKNISFSEEIDWEIVDELIEKNRRNFSTLQFTRINEAKKSLSKNLTAHISLDEHFEKGFFYKGYKWTMNWNELYGYNYITEFKHIYAKNGLFYIEIENITYPFYGHVVLDLKESKIVRAERI